MHVKNMFYWREEDKQIEINHWNWETPQEDNVGQLIILKIIVFI